MNINYALTPDQFRGACMTGFSDTADTSTPQSTPGLPSVEMSTSQSESQNSLMLTTGLERRADQLCQEVGLDLEAVRAQPKSRLPRVLIARRHASRELYKDNVEIGLIAGVFRASYRSVWGWIHEDFDVKTKLARLRPTVMDRQDHETWQACANRLVHEQGISRREAARFLGITYRHLCLYTQTPESLKRHKDRMRNYMREYRKL